MERYLQNGILATVVLGLVCLAIGCGGGEEFQVAPVSGQITMDNEPLKNVVVKFQPVGKADEKLAGSSSFGQTNEEGRYTLELTTTGEPGAVVGKHNVRIVTPEPEEAQQDDAFEFEEPIPARYNYATTLTFDVPEDGTDKADFALTSEKDDADESY